MIDVLNRFKFLKLVNDMIDYTLNSKNLPCIKCDYDEYGINYREESYYKIQCLLNIKMAHEFGYLPFEMCDNGNMSLSELSRLFSSYYQDGQGDVQFLDLYIDAVKRSKYWHCAITSEALYYSFDSLVSMPTRNNFINYLRGNLGKDISSMEAYAECEEFDSELIQWLGYEISDVIDKTEPDFWNYLDIVLSEIYSNSEEIFYGFAGMYNETLYKYQKFAYENPDIIEAEFKTENDCLNKILNFLSDFLFCYAPTGIYKSVYQPYSSETNNSAVVLGGVFGIKYTYSITPANLCYQLPYLIMATDIITDMAINKFRFLNELPEDCSENYISGVRVNIV